ncbi:MAG: Hpt domain-containing protein [Clostridiales bacterium]|nr:MAG: Hpt domain-containing protein [Clostridiales bacterium]
MSDESFRTLRTALEKDDAESAFYAAHTLKGICSNLGFDRLFDKSSAVTEMLRRKRNRTRKG